MAKALVAVILCALLVAGVAADTGRSLLQGRTCDEAKQMLTVNNACDTLCKCATAIDKKYSVSECTGLCGKCLDAIKACKPGDKLPGACAEGTTNKAVDTCITSFLKARSG